MSRRHIQIIGYFVVMALTLVTFSFAVTTEAKFQSLPGPVISVDKHLDLSTPIFFRVFDQTENTVGVWRTSIDKTTQYGLLQLPYHYPALGLPIQELALLKDKYCSTQQDNCSVGNLSLNFNLGNLILSPNKEWLAWNEGAAWCPTTRCYGLQALVIWNVSRGERQVLLERPIHMAFSLSSIIRGIFWSPNSKEIGFIESSNENGWSRVRVIDIETKQVSDLGDGQGPITWSPTGEQLAFFGKNAVKIISRDGTLQATIDGSWMEVNDLDWSPDGTKLVITASATPILQDYRFSLFIIDIATGNITEVNIDPEELRSYTNPEWSPDGLLIGVNTSPNENELVNGLIIFDPEDETIKGNLILERQEPDWLWSSTGDAILVNLPSAERIGIFYWQEDRLEEIPPPTSLEEGIRNGEISISDPTW